MNKKVSTLVAALMAAGALVLPKDVFAQIQYSETAKDYKTVTALDDETIQKGGKLAIVFQAENADGQMVDYVAVVKNDGTNNVLVAKTFAEATINDFITYTPSENYPITDNTKTLGLTLNQQSTAWSHPDAGGIKSALKVLKNSNGKVVIATDANSISLINNEGEVSFAPYAKASKSGFVGKIVSVESLEKQSIDKLEACATGESILGKSVVLAYGDKVLSWDKATNKAVLVDYNIDEPYTWTLVQSETDPTVAYFVNEDGQYLLQDKKFGIDKRDYAVTVRLKKNSEGKYILYSGTWDNISITNVSAAPSGKIMVANVPAKDIILSGELNAWYNGKGLNFTAGKDVQGNLFGGDKVVFSYTLNNSYTLPSSGVNPVTIPAGTYFFTDAKFLNGKGAGSNLNASDIDWLNSTLIAVSSTETNESTDTNRAAGEGFELVEKLGKEFDVQVGNEKPQGADLSFHNAAFTVHKNSQDVFALSLAEFWYQPNGTDYDKKDQVKESIKLGVEGYTTDKSIKVLVSKLSSNDIYTFSFTNSAALNTRTLLKETKEAAVYTIKFVKGLDEDKNLIDKYLTAGTRFATGSNLYPEFYWEAKPNAIFDESLPIYQWIITNVSDEETVNKEKVYKEVTFTNRETGLSFTTSLFKEANGYYSMSKSDMQTVIPYTVKAGAQNTYNVERQGHVSIDSNIQIELTPVTVDEHAGFLDVEDGTIRTMALARDKYTTSNRLFASVQEIVYNGYKNYLLNDNDKFADEVADAAQWKLMKVKEVELNRNYVYNNVSTASANVVTDGDKVKAYVYALQYIEDGAETGLFLSNNSTSLNQISGIEESEDLKYYTDVLFVIRENVDGSVSLMDYNDVIPSGYDKFAAHSTKKVIDAEYYIDNNNKVSCFYTVNDEYVYDSASDDNDVRVYLDPEHKEISWPAESGHITLLSEMNNYVNMNENREGIEVAEKDANSYYLHVTDKNAVVPSFYLSLGKGEGSNASSERMFMFNPVDSVNYYVADGAYDTKYEWAENTKKLMFKAATMNETADTLTTTIKGEVKKVAMKADDNNKEVFGGLNRFKFQIVETEDADGYYYIRQIKADRYNNSTEYLGSVNSKMTFVSKDQAMKFHIESVEAPTSNEGVAASEVKVVAQNGAVVVKNAAGKNVVVSTILGQVVANEVLTSDNATINVPAGIVVVAVEGESFKVNVK